MSISTARQQQFPLHAARSRTRSTTTTTTTAGRVSQESNVVGGGGGGGGCGGNGGVPSNDELVEEGRALCRDYISHRLRRSGFLAQQRQLDSLAFGAPSAASEELRLVGEELEAMYPDLFKNIHRQLNLTMHSEEVVRRTYAMFAEQLCRDGVHWGKVVALFAMAGAFAVDCAAQGHLDSTQKIVDAFGTFVSARLCGWLAQQGGWIIPEVTRGNQASDDQTGAWIAASFVVLAVLILALLLLS